MKKLCGLLIVLSVIAVLAGGQLARTPSVSAQDGDTTCTQMVATALSSAQEVCANLERGKACYGADGVTASKQDSESGPFMAVGDVLPLADLFSLATTSADTDNTWGIAVLMLPATLPEGATGSVKAIAYGETQIGQPAVVGSDRPTITITNSGSSEVNLRNGAGITYNAIGKLAPGESAVADGRNEQADWVRIQTANGPAWVFTPLITWEGDVQTLAVLLPDDVTPSVQSGEPFQSITLVTGPESATCGGSAPSGLLLQFTADQPATVQINGTTLASADGLIVARATANDALQLDVISGTLTVTARGVSQDVTAGEAVAVPLGGDDGLTPAEGPTSAGTYAFADIAHTPIDLLASESLPCVVGLGADQTSKVTLRVGPGQDRGALADMKADQSYIVLGWANDPDGSPWWQLDTGADKSWVSQADVTTFGACELVAEVEAPGLVTAAPAGNNGGESSGGANMSGLAPTTNSVWQMIPGSDNMSGECSGAPAINFCDHLAAIAPISGGISWKGMEATPYNLAEVQPNVYAYSGPNALGTGTVNISLSFTSATSLTMTETLTLSSEPNCQHTYYYTGTKNW